MSNRKHTPGPWTVGVTVDTQYQWPVFRLNQLADPNDVAELQANAQLISAAPMLLDQLIKVQAYLAERGTTWTGIENAIQKATGGAE